MTLRTTDDLFVHYDVVETPEERLYGEESFTRFYLKAGTDTDHVCRELHMGGHETIYAGGTAEKPWVEVMTNALKEFEKK